MTSCDSLHIDFAKLGYRASNKVNATKQMVLYIQRLKAIEMHGAYLEENATTTGGAWDQPSDAESTRSRVEIRSEPEGDGVMDNGELEDDDWDTWYDEEDEDEDDPQELADAGVQVRPLMGFKELRQWGQHNAINP